MLKRIRAGTLPAVRYGRNHLVPTSAVVPVVNADPVLADIVRRLVDGYDPERVYLFGSAARGEAGTDSDYDLLFFMPDDAEPERRRARMAYRELLKGAGARRPPSRDGRPRCPPAAVGRRGIPLPAGGREDDEGAARPLGF